MDIVFNLHEPKLQQKKELWSYHWKSPSGETWLSYKRQGSRHWLRFPGLADFYISAEVKRISCFPASILPLETVRHLLLDQVLPRYLAYQGNVMLHASAVQHERGLILFTGDSGSGKSTLAGNFHQAGNPVIADDCVLVMEKEDQVRAVPSYGGLRLWEDSLDVLFSFSRSVGLMAHYSDKKRISLGETFPLQNGEDIPVLAMVVLSPDGRLPAQKITIERLPHREAYIALLKQTFQLDLKDIEGVKNHVQALGHLVQRQRVFHLAIPRDYDLLPVVRQKILEVVL